MPGISKLQYGDLRRGFPFFFVKSLPDSTRLAALVQEVELQLRGNQAFQ